MIKILTVSFLIAGLVSCDDGKKDREPAKPFLIADLASPSSDSAAQPYLVTDPTGTIHLSWVEKNGKQSTLRYSSFLQGRWSEPTNISSGNNWFVNWADYPVLASDGKGNLLAHFLEKSAASTYAYDIKMVHSVDSGRSWSEPKLLHDDGKRAEHGFVSMVPYKDKFFAAWLDGRNSPLQEGHGHDSDHGQMTIRGAIIDRNGNKESEWELDNRVCDCCQTGAAISPEGPVVIYRDRSEDEIRDISIVRFLDGKWTTPKVVHADNWKVAGCPVNGPRIDALSNSLAIAWFSMPDQKGQVNIIFSENGGNSFGNPVRIDEGKAIGRVDVVLIDEKTALVCWMEGSSIKAASVSADGTKANSFTIATSFESRSSGFPQMTRSGNMVMFAWTDSKEKKIKLATVTL